MTAGLARLAEVGGGGWNPARDSQPWVRFCLTAHYHQAQTLLRRTRETELIYIALLHLVAQRGLPDRIALALLQAAIGAKVRNASYRVSADISSNLASRDLKQMTDAKLPVAEGERRGRRYGAGKEVANIRDAHRLPKGRDDPFEIDVAADQPSLFGAATA